MDSICIVNKKTNVPPVYQLAKRGTMVEIGNILTRWLSIDGEMVNPLYYDILTTSKEDVKNRIDELKKEIFQLDKLYEMM
jgi:hypothetical protein